MKNPDVLIAGGGVAGASAAIALGRAGLRVELFEARELGRDKPCGEGLMPAAVEVLERLGVLGAVGGAPFRGIRYHVHDFRTEAPFPNVPGRRTLGLGQRRVLLDRVLLEAASGTPGVSVHCQARVRDVLREHGRVVGLRVGEREYRAPLTIAADGPASAIRARLELSGPRRAGRLGIVTHFRLAARVEAPPWVEVFVGRGHEFYVTPLPEQRMLVACLLPSARARGRASAISLFYERLRDHPALGERLRGATQITPFSARAPLAARAAAGFFPGAVLIGDAAEAFDPITGGGIAQALTCSEVLAPFAVCAIEHGDEWLARFDRARNRRLRDHRLLTRWVLAMADKPWLSRPLLRFLERHQRLFSHLVGVAGGTRPLFALWPASDAGKREELGERAREH